jgi:hypothetical protein
VHITWRKAYNKSPSRVKNVILDIFRHFVILIYIGKGFLQPPPQGPHRGLSGTPPEGPQRVDFDPPPGIAKKRVFSLFGVFGFLKKMGKIEISWFRVFYHNREKSIFYPIAKN